MAVSFLMIGHFFISAVKNADESPLSWIVALSSYFFSTLFSFVLFWIEIDIYGIAKVLCINYFLQVAVSVLNMKRPLFFAVLKKDQQLLSQIIELSSYYFS